jgi:hypothetical protein
MARIIFTTCGTSVLSSACWKFEKVELPSLCGATGAELREKQAFNERTIKAFIDECEHSNRNCAQQLANTIKCELLKEENIGGIRDLPAEVASLIALNYLLKQGTPPQPLRERDKVILLHSLDKVGKLCAEVVKYVLDIYLQGTGVAVKLEEVGDIDPDRIGPSMEQLSEKCGSIMDANPGSSFLFNLTAGYKAMGITLSSLATAYVSPPYNRRIIAYYIHETSSNYQTISFGSFSPKGIEWIDGDTRNPNDRRRLKDYMHAHLPIT